MVPSQSTLGILRCGRERAPFAVTVLTTALLVCGRALLQSYTTLSSLRRCANLKVCTLCKVHMLGLVLGRYVYLIVFPVKRHHNLCANLPGGLCQDGGRQEVASAEVACVDLQCFSKLRFELFGESYLAAGKVRAWALWNPSCNFDVCVFSFNDKVRNLAVKAVYGLWMIGANVLRWSPRCNRRG